MNTFLYDEITIGMEQAFESTVTENDMLAFRTLSQDTNPLHSDDLFAVAKGFPQKVVFGMLTASYYSALAGVYIPGEHCLLYQVDVKFKKPTFVGENLRVVGRVTEKSDALKMITVKGKITNEKNEVISTAIIKAGVL